MSFLAGGTLCVLRLIQLIPIQIAICSNFNSSGNMVSFTFGPFVEEDQAVTVFVLEENSDVFALTLPLDNRRLVCG